MVQAKDFVLKTLNNAIVPMIMDLMRNAIYGQKNLNILQPADNIVKEGE